MIYSLVKEPWILAERLGSSESLEVGLQEALIDAHEYHAIRDPLPTVEFGKYRLLVAFVLDIFFLEPGVTLNPSSLRDLYRRGQFDANAIDAYITRHADRFDLFGPHPFLQTAGLEGSDKPLAGLLHPMPSGTNAAHFHHGREEEFGVCPKAAARLLTTIAPFMTAGGRGDGGQGQSPSINGAPPFYVLVTGENLFQTLCRNLFALPLTQSVGTEPPAWRSVRTIGGNRCTGASYAQSLTWQPRRIRLVPGEGGQCSLTGEQAAILVRTMKFGPGDSCDFIWTDPNCAYRFDAQEKDIAKARKVMRPRAGREIWRDTGPLALLHQGDQGGQDTRVRYQRPRVLDQLEYVGGETGFELTVYGMRTDMKMKVFEWQRERLEVPDSLVLRDSQHHGDEQIDAQNAMDRASAAARLLRGAITVAYPREGKGNDKAFNALLDYAERDFWQSLKLPYREFLRKLSPGLSLQELQGARAVWKISVIDAAWNAAKRAIAGLDTERHAIERQTRAMQRLEFGLRFVFETAEEKKVRETRRKEREKAAKAAAKLTGKAAGQTSLPGGLAL